MSFKPLLDDCAFNVGAIDEPSPESEIAVRLDDGTERVADAIGIDEQAGVTMLFGFDWATPDMDEIERMADKHGASVDEITGELDPDEEIVVIRFMAPFDRVTVADLDTGGLL